MAYNTILIKRRLKSSPNNHVPTLSGGELAYDEKNYTLYYGSDTGTLTIGGSGAFVSVADHGGSQLITGSKTFTHQVNLSSTLFADLAVIDANSNKILNLATPTIGTDASNKQYVDTEIATLSGKVVHVDSNQIVGGQKTFSGHTHFSDNVSISGNLVVFGETSRLDTVTTVASAFEITNTGTTVALRVTQTGSTDVAEFKDDNNSALIIKNGGNIGIGTTNAHEKLTVNGSISAGGDIHAFGNITVGTSFGIGTATPNEALTVVGDVSATGTVFNNGNIVATGTGAYQTIEGYALDCGDF
jgi:hypothetical protein